MSKSGIRWAAVLAAMLPAFAGQAVEPSVWLGSDWNGAVPHAIRLRLDAGGGDLRLGAPLACTVPLERDADVYVVGLSVAGGAACDRLLGRRLTVTRDGGEMRLGGVSAASLTLRPAGDATIAADAQTLMLREARGGAVELALDAAVLGQRSGKWYQYGAGGCQVILELAALKPGQQWHVFTANSNGGRCDWLVGGTIMLAPTSGGLPVVRDGNGGAVVLVPK
ncbi:hypothetical protein [Luteimonas sp. TWI1416]|uniref:hypothetical protein n=1 Tax=unclassified Luteimonas TaxID=2629088 RepID=UPI00320A0404